MVYVSSFPISLLVIIEPHWNLEFLNYLRQKMTALRNNRTTLEFREVIPEKMISFLTVIIEPHWNLEFYARANCGKDMCNNRTTLEFREMRGKKVHKVKTS